MSTDPYLIFNQELTTNPTCNSALTFALLSSRNMLTTYDIWNDDEEDNDDCCCCCSC